VGPDLRDEHLMRRFLVGDVSQDEHDAVDDACAADEKYFEELCALEEELLVLHLRGELPDEVRTRFVETLPDYPARQRRLDELTALRSVIAEQTPHLVSVNGAAREAAAAPPIAAMPGPPPPVSGQPVRTPGPEHPGMERPGMERYLWWAAAAGLLIAAGAAIWWTTMQRRETDAVPPQIVKVRSSTTFVLAVGHVRSDTGKQNVFRVPRNIDDVDLEVMVRASAGATLSATLQRVGGEPIPIAGAPRDVQTREGAIVARWRVPGSILGAGDYVLTITGERSAGERDTLASAFFSIVER
jgi:hypothetical protein